MCFCICEHLWVAKLHVQGNKSPIQNLALIFHLHYLKRKNYWLYFVHLYVYFVFFCLIHLFLDCDTLKHTVCLHPSPPPSWEKEERYLKFLHACQFYFLILPTYISRTEYIISALLGLIFWSQSMSYDFYGQDTANQQVLQNTVSKLKDINSFPSERKQGHKHISCHLKDSSYIWKLQKTLRGHFAVSSAFLVFLFVWLSPSVCLCASRT